MEVILTQDIPKLGTKDELVAVKPGYGRNYLIPQGMAILATPSAVKQLNEKNKQRAHKLEKLKADALEIAEKLKDLSLTIGAKASSTGKIFGSVTSIQIAEAIAAKGVEVNRKSIIIKEGSVKDLGAYTAIVSLFKEVEVEIPFEVVAE